MGAAPANGGAVSLDLERIPFSRFGSYLVLSQDPYDKPLGDGLYLRTAHGKPMVGRPELFRLDLLIDGKVAAAGIEADPATVRMRPGRRQAFAEFCLTGPETVLIRGRGAGLQLEVPPASGRMAYPTGDGRWVLIPAGGANNYAIACTRGRLVGEAPWEIPNGRGSARCPRMVFRMEPDAEGRVEARIDGFISRLPQPGGADFDAAAGEARADFAAFLAGMPVHRMGSAADRARAAYVDWASVVPAGGQFKRPAMLMSKAHMRSVWSWDQCFNAMALSDGHPDLAWDQWALPFDAQDANGFLPDSQSDCAAHWHHGKPPVHGWALDFCMRRSPRFLTQPRLQQAFDWLERWTNWWLQNRMWDGLPFYTHGNDSGWDNATVFDVGSPTASPDLPAHLATQMDVLAGLAQRLGRESAARHWQAQSRAIVQLLLERHWRGDRFVGIHCPTGRDVECESLITSIPIVLGRRLPEEVIEALAQRIARCVTPHGVATEDPASERFSNDFHAYWRGSVWAPSTMLVCDGLRAAGREGLSRRIARAACRAMARCGFRENWDPLTGAGRMEVAYTWTSSVYLILAHEYAAQPGG